MAEKKAKSKAPSFSLPSVSIVSDEEIYKKGPVIIVFYDIHDSDF